MQDFKKDDHNKDATFEHLLNEKKNGYIKKKLYAKQKFDKKNQQQQKEEEQKIIKRSNRAKPLVLSSKAPPQDVQLDGLASLRSQRPRSRDPRFDDLCGRYNEQMFQTNYSFVTSQIQQEIKTLERQLKREKSQNDIQKIQRAISLLKQKLQNQQVEKERKILKQERRKQERELILKGKEPFYLKRSEEKKLDLVQKYKKLKEQGGVQKYLTKKRKRTAAKEHKHIPFKRRNI